MRRWTFQRIQNSDLIEIQIDDFAFLYGMVIHPSYN